LVLAGLALLLVAVVALAVVFNPSGTEAELPPQVQSVFPAPDDSVQVQSRLVVNMAPNYSLELRVDRVPIPKDEVRFSPPGRYSWEPQAGGAIEQWTAGLHQAEISWDRIAGLPDIGGYTWSFRVQ
jgi:hypothetical protein